MTRLFGTDGIRGIANQYPIIPEVGMGLGRAVVAYCRQGGMEPSVVIGRDTRDSGQMLAFAVATGVLSAGGRAYMAGVLPTPGVAYLVRHFRAGAGVVLSASHNPHEYNGFKLFSANGFKLSEREEDRIEEMIRAPEKYPQGGPPGRAEVEEDGWQLYLGFLGKTVPGDRPLKGIRLVIDCANGATFQVAPKLFERLGATVKTLFAEPDGKNINKECGSQHPEALQEEVLRTGAAAGLAFDGDGDRLVAVDETGTVLSGDQIIALCARDLKEQGRLKNDLVVSTVMSNMGLRFALQDMGIEHIATRVGDRSVMEAMKEKGAMLGGEDSGHIIFMDQHTTGDGIVSALQLLCAQLRAQKPLSEMRQIMTIFPQALINVPVSRKPVMASIPEIGAVIQQVEQALAARGRVLVRYSGTEPLCRVMVEGENRDDVERYAREIAETIQAFLGYSNSSDSSAG
ncbi:MAG: phosphoglucosamine mutase [Deltaproteobacteria bacterium]|nr:phosphoglucosamine mutase [Deltaproteobacteria bacterium]